MNAPVDLLVSEAELEFRILWILKRRRFPRSDMKTIYWRDTPSGSEMITGFSPAGAFFLNYEGALSKGVCFFSRNRQAELATCLQDRSWRIEDCRSSR
jgi:hypothetical protein